MGRLGTVRSIATLFVCVVVAACGRANNDRTRTLHPPPGDAGRGDGSPVVRGADALASLEEGGTPGAPDAGGAASAIDAGTPAEDAGVDARTGAEGAVVNIEDWVGSYDVFIDAHSVPPGCNALNAVDHLNLHIFVDDDGAVRIQLHRDWYGAGLRDSFELDEGGGILVTPQLWDVELLLIHGSDGGPPRSGEAAFRYECEGDEPVTVPLLVRITPDTTPPQVTMSGSSFPGPVFPFTLFSHVFSEPVPLMTDGRYLNRADGQDFRHDLLVYSDAETGVVVDAAWRTWPWGPGLASRFSDYDAVSGRTIHVQVDPSVVDWAGNVAVPLVDPIEVVDVGSVSVRHDFDLAAPVGLFGDAHWVADGSPCESGGCIVWDGPMQSCADAEVNGFSGLLAVRVAETTTTQLRYRMWTSSDMGQQVVWSNVDGGYSAIGGGPLAPLSAPEGPYTHSTDWTTATVGTAFGPSADQGYVFFRDCWPYQEAAPEYRFVIDWVEATE